MAAAVVVAGAGAPPAQVEEVSFLVRFSFFLTYCGSGVGVG